MTRWRRRCVRSPCRKGLSLSSDTSAVEMTMDCGVAFVRHSLYALHRLDGSIRRSRHPMTFEEALLLLRQNEQGRGVSWRRPSDGGSLCYADCTATGQHLDFVENWVARVRPYYANTHTTASSTGRLMTELREEARKVIERAVNASHDDVVLFVGAGATGAVNKLVGLLGFRISEPLEREYGLSRHVPPEATAGRLRRPLRASLESAPLARVGGRRRRGEPGPRRQHRSRRSLAASRSTPADRSGRRLLRGIERGWPFDRCPKRRQNPAPGRRLCMLRLRNGSPLRPDRHASRGAGRAHRRHLSSTHKFPGGPQGSGVLVANRALFRSSVPERPGGGTVDYVAAFEGLSADYTRRLDEREEGGTPSIWATCAPALPFWSRR